MPDLYLTIDTGILVYFLEIFIEMVLEHFRSPTMYDMGMVTFLINIFLLIIEVQFFLLECIGKE